MERDIDEIVSHLRGDLEDFKRQILDADGLMRKLCANIEAMAARQRRPEWSIIGSLTGHGSGMSSAIWEYYKPKAESEKQ